VELQDKQEVPSNSPAFSKRESENRAKDNTSNLMEKILARQNMIKAYKRVKANKGSHGVDGMSVDELRDFLIDHWLTIKQKLLEGNYSPLIGKESRNTLNPTEGSGCLGIPTVLDRLIQQAIAQELTKVYDPTFSEHSYGFRPNKSAH
jgi:RNA-directed DNA polymerase